ncbi:MAG: FtsX-like permease family protein [Sedimentisphaerales bacterium]|nr:FtsX-like permease family protein [Sedimentisphaerales bacterium]
MLKLFLWLRYLRKRRIVFLSIAAVALSVSLLMVIASGFTGFIKAYEQIAVDFVGDIVLQPPRKFPNYPVLLDRLEQLGAVEAAEATLSGQGVLYLGKGNVRAVHIQGIDLARAAKVTAFKSSLLKQKSSPNDPSFKSQDSRLQTQESRLQTPESRVLCPESCVLCPGGFVGIAVVREPDEKTDEYDFEAAEEIIGKPVVLTTGSVIEQKDSASPPGETQFRRRTLQFTVADIIFTGFYQVDKNYIFLPIEQLQKTLYPEQEPVAEMIQIKLSLGADVESAQAQIRGVWEGFVDDRLGGDRYLKEFVDIETAVEMQSQYVEEIRKQMGLLLLIIGVVSASVVVLVSCIFYMIVTTKRKDIAIIKSCGTASGPVAWIFVGFGGCVGIIGSGIGVVLGCVITENVNGIERWISVVSGLKLWKSSVYMFSRIPNEVNWFWVLPIVACAIAAAAIGALIPAIVAARTNPVEILRYE